MSSSTDFIDPSEIFKNACKAFRSALPEDERRVFQEFADAKSMLAVIKQQANDHPINGSRLTACCQKISSLATKLDPFFDIVNIFISTHPEYMGIAWGAIRLVFKLGTNYVSYLEKFCDMFENMGMLLPAYEDYVYQLRATVQQQGREVSPRLVQALAYVYSDLIQFCFDTCKLFSRKWSSIRLKGSFVNAMFWKPFDVRFDILLKRYEKHKELMDLEMRIASHSEAMEVSLKFDEMIRNVEEQCEGRNEHVKEMEREEIENRLHRLKEWINAPTWSELFETAQSRRTPKTAEWFLTDPTLKNWLHQIHQDDRLHQLNMLSVQGKPGYGKTTLCTSLIEYLKIRYAVRSETDYSDASSNTYIVFFYFDKQRADSVESSHAFRVILIQLLEMYRNNKHAIDIASILWEIRSGQLIATNNEIKSVIRLLLRQLRHIIMVFDGLDECADQREFFDGLLEMDATCKNCSLALFSRPTIKLPRRYMEDCFFINLQIAQNLEDIRRFLRPKIKELIDDQVLALNTNIEDTVGEISNRANGMFLWATLFIEYLQFPGLTMRQRSEAIHNLNRLEGLDALYKAILYSLMERSPKQARMNVQLAFQWVAWSYRPLHLDELRYAMSISLDRKMDSDDIIPDFSRSLSHMSGALMEINSDMTVRFIHLSVLEYLTESPQSKELEPTTLLAFTAHKTLAHRCCASLCLSYLIHNIPAVPLGGSPQTSPDRYMQRLRFPFLEYAAEFWSNHLLDSIKALKITSRIEVDGSIDRLFNLASIFLSNKSMIAAWIEASWMFNHPPQIGSGLEDKAISIEFEKLCVLDSSQRAGFLKATEFLIHLANDLKSLNDSWSDVLRTTPNEIWEPSVSAFIKSDFWIAVPGAKLTAVASNLGEPDKFVCVKSQLSSSGLEVGVIKVWPPSFPRSPSDCTKSVLTEGWKVGYELWSLTSKSTVFQTSFIIPPSTLIPFIHLETGDSTDSSWVCDRDSRVSFQFPSAISSDLRHVAVLSCIAKIKETSNTSSSSSSPKQSKTRQTQFDQLDLSVTSESRDVPPFHLDWHEFHPEYALQMSSSGEFLLVMHTSSGCVEISSSTSVALWLLRIYRDRNFQSLSGPNYVYTASIAFKPITLGKEHAEKFVVFHPYLPLITFTHGGTFVTEHPRQTFAQRPIITSSDKCGTVLWNFSNKALKPFGISSVPMLNIRFSNDGSQLYGNSAKFFSSEGPKASHHMIKITIPQSHYRRSLYTEDRRSNTGEIRLSRNYARHSIGTIGSLSHGPVPMTQESNTLIFGRDQQGMINISELRQVADEGALVLQTMREDGIMASETLTRLPNWSASNYQATLLKPFDDDGTGKVSVVLNRAARPFQSYYSDEVSGPLLPTILERNKSTITTFEGVGTYSLQGGMISQGMSRKRLGWNEDFHGKRPRCA